MLRMIRNILVVALLSILTASCDDFFSLNLDLGSGYELSRVDTDDYKIVMDDKIVVGPTIVSFDFNESYIIGLGLKTVEVVCENGPNQMVTKDHLYFIVNKDKHQISRFDSKADFVAAWAKIDPHKNFKLNFDKLEETWAYLNAVLYIPLLDYWEACKPL